MAPPHDRASLDTPPCRTVHVGYTQFVRVVVGEQKEVYCVHTEKLTAQSSFFAAALARGSAKAKERRVSLPQCDTNSFWSYVRYLYHDYEEEDELLHLDSCNEEDEQYEHLAGLYALANHLGDTYLSEEIFQNLEDEMLDTPSPVMIQLAYRMFPAGHRMRRLLVKQCRELAPASYVREHRETLPTKFIYDFVTELHDSLEEVTELYDDLKSKCLSADSVELESPDR